MRLIDADEVKQRVVDTYFDTLIPCVIRAVDDSPTVDAEPVRHGHWIEIIEDGKMKRVTSCCGDDQTKLTVWYKPDYCPNCGAKMEEVSE